MPGDARLHTLCWIPTFIGKAVVDTRIVIPAGSALALESRDSPGLICGAVGPGYPRLRIPG